MSRMPAGGEFGPDVDFKVAGIGRQFTWQEMSNQSDERKVGNKFTVSLLHIYYDFVT
jgi:hypothetical protein